MRPDTSKTEPTQSAGASAAPDTAVRVAGIAFDRLFARLPSIALAVSGGADSTALMHLAVSWRAGRIAAGAPAPTISMVTVDHRLRDDSTDEAGRVAAAARALGLDHVTLTWGGPKPASGIQAAARAKRYGLLQSHLESIGVAAVATAHTADDQAETLLMRLARGSGIDGLAAMRPCAELGNGHWLLRPLLDVEKVDLIAHLLNTGVAWIDDPSNERLVFERVRVREALTAAAARGFAMKGKALSLSARRARRAADALTSMTERIWSEAGDAAVFSAFGHASLDWAWLLSYPEEIRFRLLAALVDRIGGQADAVSLGQLEASCAGGEWVRPAGLTLHGTEWVPEGGARLAILREPGRLPLEALAADCVPDRETVWDRRFAMSCMGGGHAGTLVRPLGADGLAALQAVGFDRPRVAARVLWTVPALWADARLVSVPCLGFSAPGFEGMYRSEPLLPHFGAQAVSS